MPFISDEIHLKYNTVIRKHQFNESYRLELALNHYAFIGNKSKRSIAELYDINLNSLKSKWSKSNYPKKSKNGVYLNPLYSNNKRLNTKMELL